MPVGEIHVLSRTHKLTFYCLWNTERSLGFAIWLYTRNKKAFLKLNMPYSSYKKKKKNKVLKGKITNGQMSPMTDLKVSHCQVVQQQQQCFLLKNQWELLTQVQQKQHWQLMCIEYHVILTGTPEGNYCALPYFPYHVELVFLFIRNRFADFLKKYIFRGCQSKKAHTRLHSQRVSILQL